MRKFGYGFGYRSQNHFSKFTSQAGIGKPQSSLLNLLHDTTLPPKETLRIPQHAQPYCNPPGLLLNIFHLQALGTKPPLLGQILTNASSVAI
jgi:hypothetical protein